MANVGKITSGTLGGGLIIFIALGVWVYSEQNRPNTGANTKVNFQGYAPVIDELGNQGGYQELPTPTPTPRPYPPPAQNNYVPPIEQQDQDFTNPMQNCPGGVVMTKSGPICRQKQNSTKPIWDEIINPEQKAGIWYENGGNLLDPGAVVAINDSTGEELTVGEWLKWMQETYGAVV